MSFTDRGEWPKAPIAGYEPSAGNEYLFAALDRAITDLRARPERQKIIIVAHDGSPVWSGREGRDWDLSILRVKLAEQKGIKVIGLFPGEGEEEKEPRHEFTRIVLCCR